MPTVESIPQLRPATRNLTPNRFVSHFFFVLLLVFSTGCTERRQNSLIQESDEKTALSRYGDSAELLRKAIALNPESKAAIKAIYKLGFVSETYLRDFESALSNYLEFVRLSQDPVSVYEVKKRIANIYFEQHRDPQKAITAYRQLIALNQDSLEIDFFQFRIAQASFRQNNFEQARLEYQKLLERFPKSQYNARSRFEIGNSYYMEGKYEIALEALKQVMRHHGQSDQALEAQFLTGECLEHLDKLAAALQVYESLEGRYTSAPVLAMRLDELKKRMKKEK